MSDPLRPPPTIALVRQRYNAAGGAERFVSRAIAALQAQGAEITLITRRWEQDSPFALLRVNPFYMGNVWRDWSFARGVARLLRQQPFALVQSHERLADCDIFRAGDGVHATWLAQRRRDMGWWGRLALALNPYHHYTLAAERRMFASPRLRAVICNSHMVQQDIHTRFAVPLERLPVIYNGVDLEQFHPRLRLQRQPMREQLGLPSAALVLLYVGSGFARKGVAAAIQGLAHSGRADVQLVIAGRDKHAPRYERLARQSGVAAQVHFLGPRQDVAALYGMADALILPTRYDPFPNVTLEAMASGLPVLTTLQCGAAELIEQGVHGYVCDAPDTQALARQIASLSIEQCARMGEAARQRVAPYPSERMAGQLLALYQRLLASPTPPA
jgi:UDP-glucose:(heptosyl)LPS alpha-1,3-glucosyltransferase